MTQGYIIYTAHCRTSASQVQLTMHVLNKSMTSQPTTESTCIQQWPFVRFKAWAGQMASVAR
jgi:hypothetical protein